MDEGQAIALDIATAGEVPRAQVAAARRRIEALQRYADRPITGRLTLRRDGGRYLADASVRFDGRLLAAHAAGPNAAKTADTVADRLRRQLRRVVSADVARRNEPRVIEAALAALTPQAHPAPQKRLKPPEERAIVRRHTSSPASTTTRRC
jgi:ribosome-associated translation inhibitor RaiA